MNLQDISNNIEICRDFPKKGIIFRDISPLMMNTEVDNFMLDCLKKQLKDVEFDVFVGLESRGFLFKNLANMMNKPFAMIRKGDKLPNSKSIEYNTEYSKDKICISQDFPKNKKVILIDDVLVTGGTFCAAAALIESFDCNVIACLSLIELVGENIKIEKINNYKQLSLLKYHIDSDSKILDPTINDYSSAVFEKYYYETSQKESLEKELSEKDKKLEMIEYIPLIPSNNDVEYVVFYHPSMKTLGENLISKSPSLYRRGGIRWDKFADGTPNITFENETYLENKKIIYFMSFLEGDIFEQMSFMKVLPRQCIKSLDIYLPYYHVGTMERVIENCENQLATADTLATILSSKITATKEGPPRLHVYDIHTLQNRFYFKDNIILIMETGIELLKKHLKPETIIVFPDDGAAKRFKIFFQEFNILVCTKKRDGDKRVIDIDFDLPKKVKRESAIIVDDLVQSGGTLDECRKALVKYGFTEISAYVTHVIFPNDSYKKFVNQTNGFHRFYHTNSNPQVSEKLNCEPFYKLNIEDSICNKPSKKILNIYVASTSEIKLEAVDKAFARFNLKYAYKIYKVNAESNVRSQPVGEEETKKGCINRLNYLKENIDDYDYLISIENGIFLDENNNAYDQAIVGIYDNTEEDDDEDLMMRRSMRVYFPNEYYHEAIKENKTVGELLYRDYGYQKDSWHHKFSKYTRSEILRDAVYEGDSVYQLDNRVHNSFISSNLIKPSGFFSVIK